MQEYYFKEGCYITELYNTATDPAVSVVRARVEPAQTTRWHCLVGTMERYLIRSGQGLVAVGDQPPWVVGPGATVLIPPGVRQRITNIGTEDLLFLAICTPRFVGENYRDLETSAAPSP